MQTGGTMPVLIIDDDKAARRKLRLVLQEEGYVVHEAADTEEGLSILRASPHRMLVLFNVTLFNNVMSGLDSARLLGELMTDARLADQHAYVVITASPHNVSMVLGNLLDRLAVPVVAKPFDRTELLSTVKAAALRLIAIPA